MCFLLNDVHWYIVIVCAAALRHRSHQCTNITEVNGVQMHFFAPTSSSNSESVCVKVRISPIGKHQTHFKYAITQNLAWSWSWIGNWFMFTFMCRTPLKDFSETFKMKNITIKNAPCIAVGVPECHSLTAVCRHGVLEQPSEITGGTADSKVHNGPK